MDVIALPFDEFVALPTNQDKAFELIGGEIIEVVSNTWSSSIAVKIAGELYIYLKQNPIGHLTGADGGYVVIDDRYIPDVGFISKVRQEEFVRAAYNPLAPDLAVEVVSPTDDDAQRLRQLSVKVANYLAAGTVVWVVYPDTEEVYIYEPGQAVQILKKDGVIQGGRVLPNFELPLKNIF